MIARLLDIVDSIAPRRDAGSPFAVAWLLPPVLLVMFVVWSDVFQFVHFPWHRTDSRDVAAAVNATLQGRHADLTRLRVLHPLPDSPASQRAPADADEMLAGRWRDSSYGARPVAPRFDPIDLVSGGSYAQLEIAALKVPDTYVKAFRVTGNRAYLDAAIEYLQRFLAYERDTVVPVGLLWNDHAIAERIYVVADLWDVSVRAGLVDDALGVEVLQAVERWSHYLAARRLYTFRTNHGLMQNLALMHSSLLFPTAAGAKEHWATGRQRAFEQLRYYLSREGVVSEHSAHYHAFGVFLLGVLQSYLSAKGEEIPEELRRDYESSLQFLARLRRPDGSLPRIGNTADERVPRTIDAYDPTSRKLTKLPLAVGHEGCSWYPVSGYAVWREGPDETVDAAAGSHLVLAWPRFPGFGHYRPMDFSLTFWDRGISWWTETGYWGSDDPRVRRVRGWDGTNAPHFDREPAAEQTNPRILGFACGQEIRFAELRRTASAGGEVTRQVARLSPDEWMVIDSWKGGESTFRQRWTVDQGISLRATASGRQFVARSPGGRELAVEIIGAPSLRVARIEGSSDPFGGWIWTAGDARRVGAILIESRERQGWVATYWTSRVLTSPDVRTLDLEWRSDREWTLVVRTGLASVRYARANDRLAFGTASEMISPAPDIDAPRQAMRAAMEAAADRYPPPHRLLLPQRWRVTRVVGALLALQVVLWLCLRRRAALRAAVVWGGAVFWVISAAWLHRHYFAT